MSDISRATTNQWIYPATLVRVVDGDTIILRLFRDVEVDFGFRFKVGLQLSYEGVFRLAGINAPEIHTKNLEEKTAGEAAKIRLQQLLALGSLMVTSEKPAGDIESDKYGRWLCRVVVTGPKESFEVAARLLALGLVMEWDGKGPRPDWVPQP